MKIISLAIRAAVLLTTGPPLLAMTACTASTVTTLRFISGPVAYFQAVPVAADFQAAVPAAPADFQAAIQGRPGGQGGGDNNGPDRGVARGSARGSVQRGTFAGRKARE